MSLLGINNNKKNSTTNFTWQLLNISSIGQKTPKILQESGENGTHVETYHFKHM